MLRRARAVAIAALVSMSSPACDRRPPLLDVAETGGPAASAMPVIERAAWGRALRGIEASKLRAAQLERNGNDPAVAEALASDDPIMFTEGVWTLARAWGPGAAARLQIVLGPDLPVGVDRSRVIAALALLDPPRDSPNGPAEPRGVLRELEDAIWTRYAVTDDGDEAQALLLAIARIGGTRSMQRLAADLAVLPSVEDQTRYVDAATALGVLCSRGHALSKKGLEAIAQGLLAVARDVQAGTAYALGRCAGPSAELLAGKEREGLVERLAKMLDATGDPERARLAWRALAALGELPRPIPAAILVDAGLPWQVHVQAVRALTANAAGREELVRRLGIADDALLAGPTLHAVLESLRGLRSAVDGSPGLVDRLQPMQARLDSALDGAQGSDLRALVLARCELELLRSIRSGNLGPLAHCADARVPMSEHFTDSLAVEALLHMRGNEDRKQRAITGLIERARTGAPPVAARALSALAEVDDPQVNAVLRAALAGRDVGVVSAAAAAIAARSVDSSKRDPDAVDALRNSLSQLDNGSGVEARIAAVEALGSLARGGGSQAPAWLEPAIMPLASDPNVAIRRAASHALLPHVSLRARFEASVPASFAAAVATPVVAALGQFDDRPATALRVHTGVGVIEVDLRGVPARIAQASLAALADKGYFDGLKFHRVVPDFVVQGGDPRGDGYGGPGYLMPCEWSNLRYRRGAVGIALAGKDTGGSQLFITHSPQPHLDGRYTIIGFVSAGMDVVDRIFSNESIERVEVVRGPS